MPLPVLRYANLLGFILVIALNVLANALPINGMTTGELSSLYPNRFVPAGFTFGIWGLIYLSLLGFVIFQFFSSAQAITKAIGLWFVASCIANASWILVWHYQWPLLALGVMGLLLFSLVKVYLKAAPFEWPVHWPAKLPFQLYLGWISVATIANATAVLVDAGWQGGAIPELTWAALMVAVATAAGLFFAFRFKDIFYNGVILWAFYGIYARQAEGGVLEITLIAAAVLLVASIGYLTVRSARMA